MISRRLRLLIATIVLLIDGLLFNSFALGADKRLSADVIRDFFYFSSGTTMIGAILLSMKLFAEEVMPAFKPAAPVGASRG